MSTAGHVVGAVLRFLFAVIRFVVVLAARERMAAFVIFVTAVVLVLFFKLHMLILAPPRTDKTGLLADQVIRHPGPVLTTSTRADLHQLTSSSRRARGPVHVFNPEGVGVDVPSTFRWDLLGACTDELTA